MTETDTSESQLNEESFSYPGWRVTIASGVGVFVSFGSLLVYTFGIFLKPLTEEFAWSRQAVSLAFGIAAMGVACASPPLGYLIDRLGPRRIILSCLTIFGCAVRIPGCPDPSHRASLRNIRHPGSGWQWCGSSGLLASCLHLV